MAQPKMILSPIKWTGAKRLQAADILKQFPALIRTYYEPFCGGGAVLLALLTSTIKVSRFIISDINDDLIKYWLAVKNERALVVSEYSDRWSAMKVSSNRGSFFNDVRQRFNVDKNIHDFIFLTRTSINGLIRYNSKGEYNSPFCHPRDGMMPHRFSKLIRQCSELFRQRDIVFLQQDYQLIRPSSGDFCYFDPPYSNTKGIYHGRIDLTAFWNFLRQLPCGYVLSFDGRQGDIDKTFDVPNDVFTQHFYSKRLISGFQKIHSKQQYTSESIYCKNLP